MTYLIIAEWDENNKPVKTNTFGTQAEIDDWFTKASDIYPDAIVGVDPGPDALPFITVDPVGKTFTYDDMAHISHNNLEMWKREIAATDADITPRTIEEIYDALSASDLTKLSQVTKDKFANRKTIRNSKP